MASLIMVGPALTEIIIFSFLALTWILGIIVVCRKEELTVVDKVSWSILILGFSIFALFAFHFWYLLYKKSEWSKRLDSM